MYAYATAARTRCSHTHTLLAHAHAARTRTRCSHTHTLLAHAHAARTRTRYSHAHARATRIRYSYTQPVLAHAHACHAYSARERHASAFSATREWRAHRSHTFVDLRLDVTVVAEPLKHTAVVLTLTTSHRQSANNFEEGEYIYTVYIYIFGKVLRSQALIADTHSTCWMRLWCNYLNFFSPSIYFLVKKLWAW